MLVNSRYGVLKVPMILIGLFLAFTSSLFASDSVKLHNQFIEVVVNNDVNDTGRFAIDTTGGDPNRVGDEEQPLIYGGNNPWTSFTTIRIDGKDYVFGGPTKRRAGKYGTYGRQIEPPTVVDGSSIITAYNFSDVVAVQKLSFVESPSTGLMDSVMITYTLKNEGKEAHSVGTRVVIDTMLGSNDGAPFRVEEQAKASSAMLSGESIPGFWQAFDSLSTPRVTAQGTLRGEGLTPPDRMFFVDWGTPADDLWNFDFRAGSEFLRKGEGEPDSATVLFWDPKPLAPGETRTYSTLYGLGGITIAPGSLAIGITAPASVQAYSNRLNTFTIVAYIDNNSEVRARDVVAKLNLPEGFRLASAGSRKTSLTQSLGNIPASGIGQAAWTVEVVTKQSQTSKFSVTVSADNTESNIASRSIRVIGPPAIKASGKYSSGQILATVKNPGPGTAEDVEAKLLLPKGVKIYGLESLNKPLGPISPGESVSFEWQLDTSVKATGEAKIVVTSSSSETGVARVPVNITAQQGAPSLSLMPARNKVKSGEPVIIDIKLANASSIADITVDLSYDDNLLEIIRASRGTLLVKSDGTLLPWTYPDLEKQGIVRIHLTPAKYGKAEGSLITLHGLAQGSGNASVKIVSVKATDTKGKPVVVPFKNITITIE